MKHALVTVSLLVSVLCAGRVAEATVIGGVDISDAVVFEVPLNGDFSISTSQDIYIFAPSSLVGDVLDFRLNGSFVQVAPVTITANNLILDFGSAGSTFDLLTDVIIKVLQPIGDLTLVAGGSIVIAVQEIPELFGVPEPATGLLLGLGLLLTGAAWRLRRPAARAAPL